MTQEELKSLLSLSDYPCKKACEWAAGRTPDKLKLVAAAKDLWRRWVATRTSDPEILAMLANDQYWLARYRTAQNPNTPPDILAMLATDSNSFVWNAAILNPNTPAEATT